MTQTKGILINGDELKVLERGSSFAPLLHQEGDEIRCDVLMLLNPEESTSGGPQADIAIIYPGCRARGHSHTDREEVYFLTKGRGIMGVDGEEWELKAGDNFYVHPGRFHTTYNPYGATLRFFGITIDVE
jgi:mannose-6-phosphate isomerase-like protein (cupin superfamily)